MTLIVFLRVLVVGLAAYRLARAIANDSITEPFRDWLYVGAYGEDPQPGDEPVGGKFWQWAYSLVSCPFCCSWWIALGLYALWINVGWTRPFIGAIAVAGVAAQLAGFDRALARVIDRD